MPVLVTGATGLVGRALARALIDLGGEVRAYVRRDDPGLRALGCKVALGDADDEGRLESALEQVHTLALLAGGPPRPGEPDPLREGAAAAARAAENAGVRRVVTLSCLGADPASSNGYLAAHGAAEDAIGAARIEHVIFRCSPIVARGSWLCAYLERARGPLSARAPGSGDQRLNPVALSDVVRALVRADDREGPVEGIWELGGPDVVSFDELVERALGRVRIAHRRSLPGVPAALAEVWASDQVADPAKAVAQFGLRPTSLRVALSRALGSVSS